MIRIKAVGEGTAVVSLDGDVLGTYTVGDDEIRADIPGRDGTLTLSCTDGTWDIEWIIFDKQ